MVKLCSSCNANVASDRSAASFPCPKCQQETLVRCGKCRKTAVVYKCKCGFEGP